MILNKITVIILTVFIIFLTLGVVSADNDTFDNSEVSFTNSSALTTHIETQNITSYYNQETELVSYLKDSNNQGISDKKVTILINNKIYNKITDNQGKFVLKLNLKPNTYSARLNFDGDDNYTQTSAYASVKVNKLQLSINTKNFKTYWHSDLFFKAKIVNKITKDPVKGIKVSFKVYENQKKYRIYYATTDSCGIAKLKKNFKTGSYKVVTTIKKNKFIKFKKSKAKLTVRPTAETGCCSLFVHVNGTESVNGFRRDATNALTVNIIKTKWNGRNAIKQYKTNSYFFHSITTADGWMIGNGGLDNPNINRVIEKLAGSIVQSGEIKKSILKKIQSYEKRLGLGHFSIKAPNGRYAAVWANSIKTGKLKAGEYISVPNSKSLFRHGTWDKFGDDVESVALKIAATDKFGLNRRDITVFHWKATTKEGKTTSNLKVYASNDNGEFVKRSTAHLKDDIKYKGVLISKNELPLTPEMLKLGTHKFKNIDKLKTQTITKISNINKNTLKITVKNKNTKKPLSNLKLKLKINNTVYTIKTDKKGVARFSAKSLNVGNYDVLIYTDNLKYSVSAERTVTLNT